MFAESFEGNNYQRYSIIVDKNQTLEFDNITEFLTKCKEFGIQEYRRISPWHSCDDDYRRIE